MRRNVNLLRLFGNIYIAVILLYLALSYYVFMIKDVLEADNKTVWTYIHIVVMHLNIFLFLASFFQTIISDPGKVPLFWGFFLEDPDHKRRRYCLICHIFKPERSHHCSACNRCVLNMDHHCPWLNNCIGFYNRKYFLLLLFYSIVTMGEVTLYYLITWIQHIIFIFENGFSVPVNPYYLTLVLYVTNTGMFIVVSMFFRFHVNLVIQNMTTIEHMDKKRGNEAKSEVVNYDMGVYYNFIQIFGKNPWLWFIPFTLNSGKPVGDGVVWPQKPSNAQKYEIDMSVRNVGATSEQGSAIKERPSPGRGETNQPLDRVSTPFNVTNTGNYPQNTYNPPQDSGYKSGLAFSNPYHQGNYDRPNYYETNNPQLSDRSHQTYGRNDAGNYGASGYYRQSPFDQTQQIEGYPSQR